MLGKVLLDEDENLERGDLIEAVPNDFLVITKVHGTRERLRSRAKSKGFPGDDSGIVQLEEVPCGGRLYVGVRTVEHHEELSLLNLSSDRIAVRFKGEYRILEIDRTRFERKQERHLIRNGENDPVGIYHAEERCYLSLPETLRIERNRRPSTGKSTASRPRTSG